MLRASAPVRVVDSEVPVGAWGTVTPCGHMGGIRPAVPGTGYSHLAGSGAPASERNKEGRGMGGLCSQIWFLLMLRDRNAVRHQGAPNHTSRGSTNPRGGDQHGLAGKEISSKMLLYSPKKIQFDVKDDF